MNRLGYLRRSLNLTYRALEKEVGIDRTSLNNTERGKILLTESRINALCNFYQCSADFLIGKTDEGIFMVYDSPSEHSGYVINITDYERYKESGDIVESIVSGIVIRSCSKSLNDKLSPFFGEATKDEIIREISDMSYEDLLKVLKFIQEFLK